MDGGFYPKKQRTKVTDEKQRTPDIGLAKAGLTKVIEHLRLISAYGFQPPCFRQSLSRCARNFIECKQQQTDSI
jgi:hypothetical protein